MFPLCSLLMSFSKKPDSDCRVVQAKPTATTPHLDSTDSAGSVFQEADARSNHADQLIGNIEMTASAGFC